MVYEALMALLFNLKAFFNWCKDKNRLINIEPNVRKAVFDGHSSFAETSKGTEDIEHIFFFEFLRTYVAIVLRIQNTLL